MVQLIEKSECSFNFEVNLCLVSYLSPLLYFLRTMYCRNSHFLVLGVGLRMMHWWSSTTILCENVSMTHLAGMATPCLQGQPSCMSPFLQILLRAVQFSIWKIAL